MSTITIDLATAKSIASLINIAAKPKSVAPVLEQVRVWVSTDYLISAVATDRYACITASWEVDLVGNDMPEFGIGHDMAKFIAGLKSPVNGHRYVTFEVNESSVIVSSEGQSFTNDHVFGKYPPVVDLVSNWQAGANAVPVELSLTMLSRLAKITDRLGKKVEDWKIELGNSDNPNKPAPIRLSHGNLIAIQQPRIIR